MPAVMDMTVMMAPVPTTGPIVSVVAGSHNDRRSVHHRRGIHDSRRWDDEHRGGSDDDRKPDAYGYMHPRVGGTGQEKSCASHERAQTYNPQQNSWFHAYILLGFIPE
jgi:hypothetical protein